MDVDHDVWRLAVDARNECTDVFETAEAIMTFVNTNWLYQPNSTSASTHMSEVLKDRRGVCQDFAHVMVGMCRALGIPSALCERLSLQWPHEPSARGAGFPCVV